MPLAEARLALDTTSDESYPTISAPDSVYPCQTLKPFCAPFDGIATPSIWSRLRGPMERALTETWQRLGLLRRCRPSCWVTLHFGRMAVNAHGWERLRSRLLDFPPDSELVEPPETGIQALPELWEGVRVRYGRSRLRARLRRAELVGEKGLSQAAVRNPSELDTAELARGPLEERIWVELLLPWLGRRLEDTDDDRPDPSIRAAIGVEQRFAAELGRRLAGRGVLKDPAGIAYLTVEERIHAVHEDSDFWAKQVASRHELIDSFMEIEVPAEFCGRPRVQMARNG
jgi:hypothetical protein